MAQASLQESATPIVSHLRWTILTFLAVVLALAVGLALPRPSSEKGADYLALAARYQADGRTAEARRALERARTLGLATAAEWAEVGDRYRQLSAPDRAAQAYRQAVRLSPDKADYRLRLARSLATMGQDQPALAEYQEAVRRAPPGSEAVLLEMGLRYAALGEHAAAETHYLRALETYTQSASLRSALADLYLAWGRPSDALRWLQEAASLEDPSQNTLLLKLGRLYLTLGLPEEAAHAFREAVARRTGDAEAYFWLGEAQSAAGQWAQAAMAYRRAVTFRPNNVEYLRRLGRAYLRLGLCAEAREAFWKIIDLGPNDTLALEGLRRCAGP